MLEPIDPNMQQLLSFDALLNQFKAVLGPSADTSGDANINNDDDQLFQQINQLRLWRENQQQKLLDNQMTEQQLLHLEKEKLYELLGLSVASEPNSSAEDDGDYAHGNYRTEDESDSGTEAVYQINGHEPSESDDDDDDDVETPRTEIEMPVKSNILPKSPPLPKPKKPAAVDEYAVKDAAVGGVPKRPFLKRGEGLTNRFKVSPSAFRLDNLPRYKYAGRVAQALSSQRQPAKQRPQQQQQRDGAEGQLGTNNSKNTNNNNNSHINSISADKSSDVRKRIENNTNNSSGKSVRRNGTAPLKLKPRKLTAGNEFDDVNDAQFSRISNAGRHINNEA